MPSVQKMPSFNGGLLFAFPDSPALAKIDSSNADLHGIFTTPGSRIQGSVDNTEVMISRKPSNDLDKKPTEEEYVV